MSKLLIIYAHPNHEGSHGYFLKELEDALKEKKYTDYEIIDLYKINYNPILKHEELYSQGRSEISEENIIFQNKIKEADRMLFIYPTWWQNMPAILKGFIDRVFTSGFAFRYVMGAPLGLLKGKKAAIFTASGGPFLYNKYVMRNQSIKLLSKHILFMAGINSRGFILSSASKFKEDKKAKINEIANKALNYLNI